MDDPFHATPRELTERLRAIETRTEQTADWLEKLHHDSLKQAADLGYTLKHLSTMLDLVHGRLDRFEDVCRDMRLTITGIGSLAKSLSEKTHSHEEILRVVSEILRHLAQKEPPHA